MSNLRPGFMKSAIAVAISSSFICTPASTDDHTLEFKFWNHKGQKATFTASDHFVETQTDDNGRTSFKEEMEFPAKGYEYTEPYSQLASEFKDKGIGVSVQTGPNKRGDGSGFAVMLTKGDQPALVMSQDMASGTVGFQIHPDLKESFKTDITNKLQGKSLTDSDTGIVSVDGARVMLEALANAPDLQASEEEAVWGPFKEVQTTAIESAPPFLNEFTTGTGLPDRVVKVDTNAAINAMLTALATEELPDSIGEHSMWVGDDGDEFSTPSPLQLMLHSQPGYMIGTKTVEGLEEFQGIPLFLIDQIDPSSPVTATFIPHSGISTVHLERHQQQKITAEFTPQKLTRDTIKELRQGAYSASFQKLIEMHAKDRSGTATLAPEDMQQLAAFQEVLMLCDVKLQSVNNRQPQITFTPEDQQHIAEIVNRNSLIDLIRSQFFLNPRVDNFVLSERFADAAALLPEPVPSSSTDKKLVYMDDYLNGKLQRYRGMLEHKTAITAEESEEQLRELLKAKEGESAKGAASRIQKEIEESDKKIEELDKQLKEAEKKLSEHAERDENLKLHLNRKASPEDTLETVVGKVAGIVANQERQREELEKSLEAEQQNNQKLQQDLSTAQSEIESSKLNKERLLQLAGIDPEDSDASEKTALNALQHQKEEATTKTSELEEELRSAKSERDQIQGQLETLSSQLANKESHEKEVQGKIDELTAEKEHLEQELQATKDAKARSDALENEELTTAESSVEDAQKQIESLTAEKQNLQEELETQKGAAAQTEKLEQKIAEVTLQKDALQTKHDSLQVSYANSETSFKSLQERASHQDEEVKRLTAQVAEQTKKESASEKSLTEARKISDDETAKRNSVRELLGITDDSTSEDEAIRRLQEGVKASNQQVSHLEDELEHVKQALHSKEASAQKSATDYEETIATLKAERDQLEGERDDNIKTLKAVEDYITEELDVLGENLQVRDEEPDNIKDRISRIREYDKQRTNKYIYQADATTYVRDYANELLHPEIVKEELLTRGEFEALQRLQLPKDMMPEDIINWLKYISPLVEHFGSDATPKTLKEFTQDLPELMPFFQAAEHPDKTATVKPGQEDIFANFIKDRYAGQDPDPFINVITRFTASDIEQFGNYGNVFKELEGNGEGQLLLERLKPHHIMSVQLEDLEYDALTAMRGRYQQAPDAYTNAWHQREMNRLHLWLSKTPLIPTTQELNDFPEVGYLPGPGKLGALKQIVTFAPDSLQDAEELTKFVQTAGRMMLHLTSEQQDRLIDKGFHDGDSLVKFTTDIGFNEELLPSLSALTQQHKDFVKETFRAIRHHGGIEKVRADYVTVEDMKLAQSRFDSETVIETNRLLASNPVAYHNKVQTQQAAQGYLLQPIKDDYEKLRSVKRLAEQYMNAEGDYTPEELQQQLKLKETLDAAQEAMKAAKLPAFGEAPKEGSTPLL